jgi:hypothetical protein
MADEPHHVDSRQADQRKVTIPLKAVGLVVAVIILCALSFAGGRQYQKHHGGTTTAAGATGRGFASGSFGGARRSGGIGSVTAITSTSLTVNDQRSGTAKTYSISSSTQITDNGSTVDYTDIKTGDTVLVTTSSSTSTAATRILVNPSFGGGAGNGAGGQDDPTQSQ